MLGLPQVDLNHLTEEERDVILNVLKRDEDLQKKDQDRINVLKTEIRQIKVTSTLKPGDGDADKTCSRCRKPFGWIFDKGEICPKCKHKVCETCQLPLEKGSTKWTCVLCQKQRELDAMSGQWFFSKFRKSKRSRKTNRVISGTDIVKQSFKRNRNPYNGSPSSANMEVKKALNGSSRQGARPSTSSLEHEGESSDTQSAKEMSTRRRQKVNEIHNAAFPKDTEKIMLLDLLGGPSVGAGLRIGSVGSGPESGPDSSQPLQPQIEIRRVNGSRYYDSDSSSDRDSAPSSPQMSHQTESEYAPSDSIRSSFRSTSAVSSEGRITIVTDNNSYISDISTAPPSMQNSPQLSNTSSIEQSHQHYMQVTSDYSPFPSRKSPTPKPRKTVQVQKSQSPPIPEPKKSDSKSSADSAIENPSQFSSQVDSTSSLSEDATQVHMVKVVSHARSCSSSSNEDLSTSAALNDMQRHVTSLRDTTSSRHAPPKPVRTRTISSGSDTERFKSDTEFDSNDRKAPYLARDGARRSLERQQQVDGQSTDSLHSAQPGSINSVAMTDAGRATSIKSEKPAQQEDDVSLEPDDIDALVASHRAKSMFHLNQSKPNLHSRFSASVESVTSFYSDAGEGNYGKIPVTGEIQFGLDYNYKTGTFEVRIKQCKEIACVDAKKKRSDPYVKTYLLPDRTKSGKRKTRVKKHTTSPIFNELLKYHMGKSELETRTLWVTVWHNDTFGRNDFLGEVTIPLDYYEFKDSTPKWYKLQEGSPTPMSLLTYKGDLSLQLKYVTAEQVSATRKVKGKSGHKGEVHVMVKQARNLTAVRANGSSDPFCKAYLMPEKGKTTKQKSSVMKKNCNPQWKHTFIFEDVSGEELRERALDLTIWDHDRFTSNDFLGGVRLSLGTGKSYGKEVEWCDSKGEEISLWQGMLDRPNHWIEGTLLLRPNMDSRKKQP